MIYFRYYIGMPKKQTESDKADAVRSVRDGYSKEMVAVRFGVTVRTIENWMAEAKKADAKETADGS